MELYIKYLQMKGYDLWTMFNNSLCMGGVEGTDEMRLVICEFLKLGDMYMEVHYMILSNLLYVGKFP